MKLQVLLGLLAFFSATQVFCQQNQRPQRAQLAQRLQRQRAQRAERLQRLRVERAQRLQRQRALRAQRLAKLKAHRQPKGDSQQGSGGSDGAGKPQVCAGRNLRKKAGGQQ